MARKSKCAKEGRLQYKALHTASWYRNQSRLIACRFFFGSRIFGVLILGLRDVVRGVQIGQAPFQWLRFALYTEGSGEAKATTRGQNHRKSKGSKQY